MPRVGLPVLHAVVDPPDARLGPFDEPAEDLPVLAEPLAVVRRRTLEALGIEVRDAPPADRPWLRVGSRTWFTERLLRRFLEAVPDPAGLGGRLRVDHPGFQGLTEPLQRLDGPGLHELAVIPAGGTATWDLPAVPLVPALEEVPVPGLHVALAGAAPPGLFVGDEMIHQLDHWSHILRVNLLALVELGSRERRRFQEASWLGKAAYLLGLLLRARSLDPFRLAAALSRKGRRCRIHPTACVEASVLGDGVEVGPYAVVRGSVLADGARVEEHASVNLAVVGRNAKITRGAFVNLCVLMEGALVSRGGGFQACVFGREAFVALHSTILDLSFAGDVKVTQDGQRVPSGSRFLGAAVGHRACVGAGVVVGFGAEIPNGASVVADPARLLVRWPEDGRERVRL